MSRLLDATPEEAAMNAAWAEAMQIEAERTPPVIYSPRRVERWREERMIVRFVGGLLLVAVFVAVFVALP